MTTLFSYLLYNSRSAEETLQPYRSALLARTADMQIQCLRSVKNTVARFMLELLYNAGTIIFLQYYADSNCFRSGWGSFSTLQPLCSKRIHGVSAACQLEFCVTVENVRDSPSCGPRQVHVRHPHAKSTALEVLHSADSQRGTVSTLEHSLSKA